MGFLKKLLLVGATATVTVTVAGARHGNQPGTQPTVN
jgi:hypothetical protein